MVWLKAYLSNRHHYVSLDGSRSSRLSVHSGVPQGGILGLLLFLIYIIDIPDAIKY